MSSLVLKAQIDEFHNISYLHTAMTYKNSES